MGSSIRRAPERVHPPDDEQEEERCDVEDSETSTTKFELSSGPSRCVVPATMANHATHINNGPSRAAQSAATRYLSGSSAPPLVHT